jgi:hypothetical protein
MSQVSVPPAQGAAYPVSLSFERGYDVPRWLPLVSWLLVIPHMFVMYALSVAYGVVQLICFFTILFTKSIPDGLFNFQVMVLRYQWRVTTYSTFMRNEYPPFEFPNEATDPTDDPARLSITRPAEYKRFMPLIKWLLAIPHLFVLLARGIAAAFVILISFFAVLFTGRWPQGMRDFVVGVMRWSYRVNAYVGLLVDEYPPFTLS